jgi:hypothetical protein
MARQAAELLEFVGPPGRLSLVSDIPVDPEAEFSGDKRLQPFLDGVRRPFRVRGRGDDARRLRLKLNPATPPGAYEATIRSGKKNLAALITVQRAPRVTITPSELQFFGSPGGEVVETMTFWNRGNVGFDLPDHVAVGVFDDDGLETAFASTYREKPEGLEAIAGHFFGKLREAHGGLLKLAIATNGKSLAPGSVAAARISGRLPSALRSGHSYHGVWSTEFANISLSVTVTSEAKP